VQREGEMIVGNEFLNFLFCLERRLVLEIKVIAEFAKCRNNSIMEGHGNFAFNLVVKMYVELGYVFLSLRL
jgi:hypothetical protein